MVNSFALPGISFPRYHCFHTTGASWCWDPVDQQAAAVEMWTKSSMLLQGHSQRAFMKEIFHLAERREVQQVSDEIHSPLTHRASYHFGVARSACSPVHAGITLTLAGEWRDFLFAAERGCPKCVIVFHMKIVLLPSPSWPPAG